MLVSPLPFPFLLPSSSLPPDLPGDLRCQPDICVTSPPLNGAADLRRWAVGLHATATESTNARTCVPERSEVKGASARRQQRVSLNSSVGSTATYLLTETSCKWHGRKGKGWTTAPVEVRAVISAAFLQDSVGVAHSP